MIRSRKHLAWIRSMPCMIGGACLGPVQAAHVRKGTDGGTGMKPGDNWTIPLCHLHHAQQHAFGEPWFEKEHGFGMKAAARDLWRMHGVEPDPPRKKAKAKKSSLAKAKKKIAGKPFSKKFKKKLNGQTVRRDAA